MIVTSRRGIFAAGCVTGPKDIPDSVAEGSGAASLALGHLSERYWPEPIQIEPLNIPPQEGAGVRGLWNEEVILKNEE